MLYKILGKCPVILHLSFFFFFSLVLFRFIPSRHRVLAMIGLSVGFFIFSQKLDDLAAYLVLFLLNLLILFMLDRLSAAKDSKWLKFLPLLYAIIFISLGSHKYAGWSYIVLIAGWQLKQFILDKPPRISDWLKLHFFTIVSFPKISVGPIDVGSDHAGGDTWREGAFRFFAGLCKAGILLFVFREYVPKPDPVYAISNVFEVFLLGCWHYINLYLEFSGAIDMVIGIFLVWGFRLQENFSKPWVAVSVTEFWRRWHMTLGRWIMQNVYIPFGGNRQGLGRQIFNLICTMALCGVWHGPTRSFILWGILQGVGLSLEKLALHFHLGYDKLPTWLLWAITQTFVVFSWVLFFS